jgi:predicted XRE-type DNA-binding protein
MSPPDKPLVWMHGEITTPPFSANARIEAGYLLRQVQKGINMDKNKKKNLESKGYKVGSVEEFLGLGTEESEYIELKLALSEALTNRRKKSNLTQAQLAKMLKSSQSRVAKMEKGDPSVSVDLLVKSLLAMGANKKSIAKAIA